MSVDDLRQRGFLPLNNSSRLSGAVGQMLFAGRARRLTTASIGRKSTNHYVLFFIGCYHKRGRLAATGERAISSHQQGDVLYSGNQPAGESELEFDVSGLQKGVYFVELVRVDGSVRRKLTVMR